MRYLLLIHIGPVQDFIASARRSRDLWFGSWLLSEMSKVAARTIADREGGDSLIFPASAKEDDPAAESDFNVANKIVAQVESPPAELAGQVEAAVRAHLQTLWQKSRRRVGPLYNETFANDQINDLLEFFWAASPLVDEVDQYSAIWTQTEALLVARKVTRNFDPITWGSEAPKSSLDGLRESVIPEEAYLNSTDRRDEAVRLQKIERLYKQYGARPAERLSAVDLLKRHGQPGEEAHFPSTSHIAALPLLKRLEKNQAAAKKPWQNYFGLLPGEIVKQERIPSRFAHPVLNEVDGSLLFESRLAEILDGLAKKTIQKARSSL